MKYPVDSNHFTKFLGHPSSHSVIPCNNRCEKSTSWQVWLLEAPNTSSLLVSVEDFFWRWNIQQFVTPPKTNMAIENPPFEDVFSIENVDFPMSCWFLGVYWFPTIWKIETHWRCSLGPRGWTIFWCFFHHPSSPHSTRGPGEGCVPQKPSKNCPVF